MSVVSIEGNHVVLDIYDGNEEKLNNPEYVVQALRDAAEATGATVLKSEFVKFEGEGVTAFLILSESHISIHSWPSEKFAAFDIYTCGNCRTENAIEILVEKFEATKFHMGVIKRGSPIIKNNL